MRVAMATQYGTAEEAKAMLEKAVASGDGSVEKQEWP